MNKVVLAILVFLVVGMASPAGAASQEPWEFDGGGWGHGVGLSQYGSQGMALDRWSVAQIIDYYYNGADVKSFQEVDAEPWLTGPEAIWVGLSKSQTARSFEAIGNGIEVCQQGDGTDSCDAPDVTLTDGQVLTVSVVSAKPARCSISVDGGVPSEGDCWIDLTWDTNVQDRRVKYGSLQYARGSLHVRPSNHDVNVASYFHVSVSLDLEDYLYGVAETLLQWEPAALQTQAVIARSYAVRKALDAANDSGELWSSRKDNCWCHIGSTSADQNYDAWSGGLATEGDPTYGQKWRDAVDATRDEIVTHPQVGGGNTIVSTFYSSSNGGASENNEDVWGGSPRPYLRSVDDHWSADPAVNPLASWSVLVDDADVAAWLGWDAVLDAFILEGPPGLVVRFTGYDNGVSVDTTRNGTQIRSLLNAHGYKSGGGSVRVSPYITKITDPPGFDDIIGHLFEGDIDWLRARNITKGCNPPDNTLFCPDDPVSREVMAAFLNRYLDLPATAKDYYTDDDSSIFEDDINRLAAAGITKGCGGTKFCANDLVDRGQMAAFLVRALSLTDNGGGDLFVDDDNSIFENDIDRLKTAGITKGCNPPANDRFCPDLSVSRGAMAAFLHRTDGL